MSIIVKRIASFFVVTAIVVAVCISANRVALEKDCNRYYILERYIEDENQNYKIQVFGSCHAYTSFDAPFIEEEYGYSSYVFANPCEIIPVTYLRMLERFKTDVPELAVVEIWGMNAYDTYFSQEEIFEDYMGVNLELLPFSAEKIEVIKDFDCLDSIYDNFLLAKYKDRFLEMDLTDSDYENLNAFEITDDDADLDGIMCEMKARVLNNGFAALDLADQVEVLDDYEERQARVDENDVLPVEDDMLKYLEKIIDLCEKNNVKLVFFRSPYLANENEMRKVNWLADYCEEREIPFYDLESAVDFDYNTDFKDHWHLNVRGARKATEYLSSKIIPLIN